MIKQFTKPIKFKDQSNNLDVHLAKIKLLSIFDNTK